MATSNLMIPRAQDQVDTLEEHYFTSGTEFRSSLFRDVPLSSDFPKGTLTTQPCLIASFPVQGLPNNIPLPLVTAPKAGVADVYGLPVAWQLVPNIKIRKIKLGNRRLSLLKPITAELEIQDGFIVIRNEDLGIASVASEYGECLADFEAQLRFVIKEYGRVRDDELTLDALALKRRIAAHIDVNRLMDHETTKGQ